VYEVEHEPGRIAEQKPPAPKATPAPAIGPGAPGATQVLALQRGAGNAAVAAMLGGGRSAPATPPPRAIQRSPKVEFTPDPHRVSLGETRLLPGIPSKRYPFIPEKRTRRPLAEGSFKVAGIPIGYELTTDAHLTAGVGFVSTPAMLTDIELIARGAEAERLRSRPPLIPGLPFEGPRPGEPRRPRGEVEGMAKLRFNAAVMLDASAGAKLSGGVTALSNAVSAGAYGALTGSAKATAQLKVDQLVGLTWKDGAISLQSGTIPGFWLSFDLEFLLAAEAGVYVELRVPDIPVVTSLYDEIESWPGVGWFLPDRDSLRWRQEYGKKWELAARKYRHDLPLALGIAENRFDPVIDPINGPRPDQLLNEAGKKQKEELKDDPVGPGEKKLKGDAGSMADARAAAKAQLASTREIIDREKAVTARLLTQARRSAAKPKAASTGGVQMAAIDPPGGGGNADDTPVEQLEQRQDALEDADTKRKHLDRAATDLVTPAAAPDGPTRNEARLALETVAKNADKLGDDVDRGEGDLARPSETGKPGDVAAMQELGDLEPKTLALFDEARDAIKIEQERLDALQRPSNAPAGRAYKEAHDAYRKAVTKAGAQSTTLKREIEAAQGMRTSDTAGAVTRFRGLRDRAAKLRDAARELAPLRPQEPPPGSWFGFKAEHNDDFRARLRNFRGTDDLDPTHKGGEGAVFRDAGDQRVLKRWYADRLGNMRRSVKLLKATRSAVERDPVLSRYVTVVAIHEEGKDWILRDWVSANETIGSAPAAQDTVNRVVEALGRMEAGSGLPDELRTLRSRIRERSVNLRWDGQRIVVVDMM
jgi:hypothetical protein